MHLGTNMNAHKIKNITIVGGGTAGWVSAALLVKVLGKTHNIQLIESETIGIIGVGEATIPPITQLNNALGIDEARFLKATKGTIKLGIEFENWSSPNTRYMHAFGSVGKNLPFCDFNHLFSRAQKLGSKFSFGDFSLNYQAAKQGKFDKLGHIPGTNLPGIVHAYHFDASLYAKLLREYSENLGVQRIEGKVVNVEQHTDSGHVKHVVLESGQVIAGDLFIDCSGMRALLIEQTLNTGFEDWRHWLPCDRAIAIPCESTKPIAPYTRCVAKDAGWCWHIPLQHRMGNGIVYSSKFMSNEQAELTLRASLSGKPLAEPNVIKFKTGRRLKQWNKNVVAVGLSSGFLEPLESTSIHLIQMGIIRLLKCFPHHGFKDVEVAEYNRQSKIEFENVRDFIILHYKVNQREDSPFWQQCQRMDIPESLARKIELFKQSGKVFSEQDDVFTEIAWQQVLLGQEITPDDHHPMADTLSNEQLTDLMDNLDTLIQRSVAQMPSHERFLTTVTD
jgi:tryptophan halogenase